MGTNCKTHIAPVASNRCGEAGEVYSVPNFCSYRMDNKEEFCSSMSSSGEWRYNSRFDYCYSKGTTDYGFGCCNGVCGSPFGTKLKCGRVAFAGNPIPCCFQDYNTCGGQAVTGDATCFADPERQNTCDPKHRDITSDSCRDEILKYCSGEDLAGQSPNAFEIEFTKRWTGSTLPSILAGNPNVKSSPCYYALWRNMYNGQGQSCLGRPFQGVTPNSSGYVYAQKLFNGMLNAYTQNGGVLVINVDTVGTTYLNNVINDICSKYPGICEIGLKTQCSGKTLKDLAANPSLQKWCGCYLPDDQYSTYTDVYRISKECTASCNAKGVIPLSTSDGISIKSCKQSTCVIDDISIELYKNTNVGDLNFTQICPACSDEGNVCNCTLAGTTMKVVDSNVPNINLSQNCGSESACFKEVKDSQGKSSSIRVPCSSDESYDPYKAINEENLKRYNEATNKRNFRILIMVIVVVIILAILYLIVSPKGRKDTDVIIPSNKKDPYIGLRESGFTSIQNNSRLTTIPEFVQPSSNGLTSLRDNTMAIPSSNGLTSLRDNTMAIPSSRGLTSLRDNTLPSPMKGSMSLRSIQSTDGLTSLRGI